MESIGETIQKLRKSQNIKQGDFASTIGISRTHLSDVERGKKGLSIKAAEKISKALGIDVSELFQSEFQKSYSTVEKAVKNDSKSYEALYHALESKNLSSMFAKLADFGWNLKMMSLEHELFFTQLKDKLLKQIDSGKSAQKVLQERGDVLDVIAEYAALIEIYNVNRPKGADHDRYRYIEAKAKTII